MRVILVDSDDSTQLALRLLLQQQPDIELVEAVSSRSKDFQELVTQAHPDVLIVDGDGSTGAYTDISKTMGDAIANLPIVYICSRPELRLAVMSAGASAFVYKGDPPESLVRTLQVLFPRLQRLQ